MPAPVLVEPWGPGRHREGMQHVQQAHACCKCVVGGPGEPLSCGRPFPEPLLETFHFGVASLRGAGGARACASGAMGPRQTSWKGYAACATCICLLQMCRLWGSLKGHADMSGDWGHCSGPPWGGQPEGRGQCPRWCQWAYGAQADIGRVCSMCNMHMHASNVQWETQGAPSGCGRPFPEPLLETCSPHRVVGSR